MFETGLNINRTIGVNEVCVKLGVNEVKKEAQTILNRYSEQFGAGQNLNLPQYAVMSVFLACKTLKVKPPKQKLVELSQLKPAQWTLLETQFGKVQKSPKKTSEKVEAMQVDEVEEKTDIIKRPVKVEEDYETWKARILAKAYRDLKRQEKET